MKILTLNTWQEQGPWRERWEMIFSGLERYRPDIVAFQEVFNPQWAREVQNRSGFAHLVFAEEPSGLMILSRYPAAEWECLTYETGSPTEPYRRYALFARVETPAGALAFFNTHLSWRLHESAVRQKQMAELLEFVGRKSAGSETAAAGDFNAAPESAEVARILAAGFTDSYAALHPKERGDTWNNENRFAFGHDPLPDRRIDYIFFKNADRILGRHLQTEIIYREADSGGLYASDHFGLLTEFAGL